MMFQFLVENYFGLKGAQPVKADAGVPIGRQKQMLRVGLKRLLPNRD